MEGGLFHLDSATPPQLVQGGQLRPMVHATFASVVMRYEERMHDNATHIVGVAMHNALGSTDVAQSP